MSEKEVSRLQRIMDAAEQLFNEPVLKVLAPGGEDRASFRLIFADKAVIGTLRPNFRRTHVEAHVLQRLQPYCDDIPVCHGVIGQIMFQSDVGERRLNIEIANRSPAERRDLAAESVAAIFRIHSAARRTTLHQTMPQLGANRSWVENIVDAVDALQQFSGGLPDRFDRNAACERLAVSGRQFLKWDCRSGNAAIGNDDKLRWFDFEYSGTRHGAEDIAWLIGDEAWPLDPHDMNQIVRDAYDPEIGDTLDEYMDYLSVYLTFHCVQRLKLIVKEARKRGWLSKTRIRQYDDAGVHPDFAAHICLVGQYFASQSPLTAPLAGNFERSRTAFTDIAQEGRMQA